MFKKSASLIILLALLLCSPLLRADDSPQATALQASDIMEKRCMVCHGCYDAPCQLKMEAYEGIQRGASKDLVYNASRLSAAETSRLFDDAQTERRWRKKGFYPVLDDKDPQQGTMYQMLQMKQAHPLATDAPLPEGFDFSLARDQQCPKPEEFAQFRRDYSLWGMPYGLPGLSRGDHETMTRWLEQGAQGVAARPLTGREADGVTRWEAFLNGDSNRQQLMSRYIYEHLFLASLYLEESEDPAWFRIVRSSTPSGEPLKLISTRRPYDDPGTKKFYYRLQRMETTPLRKIHMPYRFDLARKDWYETLFIKPDYEVDELPGYTDENDSNPFYAFRALPERSRHLFLLEEAQFTIMNFIKGPVCRGRVALSVIDEHFWVVFEEPELTDSEFVDEFLAAQSDNLRLPRPTRGTVIDLVDWRKYSEAQTEYLHAAFKAGSELLKEDDDLAINYDAIWDGDGRNPNAALTVFRHFDTASVVKGFVGKVPKTAWIIDYALLERIHYLLVAGYDVYGSVAHQLESRLYMDFLRIEGEINFLLFMPDDERQELADYWYRNAPKGLRDYVEGINVDSEIIRTEIDFKTDDPKTEFLRGLRERIYGADQHPYDYRRSADAAMVKLFEKLEDAVGRHNSYMPSVSFVNITGEQRDQVYTIIRNSGYSNIAQLWSEEKRRLPDEDNLTVASGFLGAYPNQFFQVQESELEAFTEAILSLKSEEDYENLLAGYGVARNASGFWQTSDKLHTLQRAEDGPIHSGLFDYGRYHGY